MNLADAPKRGRGRPAARLFSLEEAADLLGIDAPWLLRALATAARSFFSGAFQRDGQWWIPERDMKALLGPGLPRLFSVNDFAQLIGEKPDTVRSWIDAGVITPRRVMGRIKIPETVYYTLPAARPAALPPRPVFFARKTRTREEKR